MKQFKLLPGLIALALALFLAGWWLYADWQGRGNAIEEAEKFVKATVQEDPISKFSNAASCSWLNPCAGYKYRVEIFTGDPTDPNRYWVFVGGGLNTSYGNPETPKPPQATSPGQTKGR